MKRYLAALGGSFFSRDLYRAVATDWKGAGLVYQLLLMAIATLVIAVRLHAGSIAFVNKEAPPLLAQLPVIDIDHGVVIVNHPMPVTITDPDSGKVLAIIDTSGGITTLDGTGASVLLTRNQLITVRRTGVVQSYDLRKVERFHLDRKIAAGWLRLIASWFAVVCTPFILAGLYAARLVVMLVAAGILFLVGRSSAVKFDTTMRLASVALTPATLIESALDGLGHKPGVWGFLWLVIAIAYLAFAWSASRPPRPAESQPETPAPEPLPPSGPY